MSSPSARRPSRWPPSRSLAGLIALAVLSQLLSRQLALDATELPMLRAIGATRGALVALSLARLAVVTAGGALIAVAVAVAASPLMPIGPARGAEPTPGVEVNLAILGAGAAAIALLPLAFLAPAAWRAAAQAAGPPGVTDPGGGRFAARPSRFPAVLSRAGSVAGALGVRLAFEPGHGRTAVPVRSALAGSVIAIGAVVAAAVFGASLLGLIGTPHEYGQNWDAVTDLGFGGVPPQLGARFMAAAPAVAQYAAGDYGAVTIGGRNIAAIGLDERGGHGYLTLLAGRAPAAPGEIALGAQTMRDLGLRLGQPVQVTANHESTPTADKTTVMRVVGVVVLPRFARGSFAPTGLGVGAVVPASVLTEPNQSSDCAGPLCYNFFLLRYRPGTDPAAQDARMTAILRANRCPITSCAHHRRPAPGRDTQLRQRPRRAARARRGPRRGSAVGTLAHVLLTSVRRRRRDLAVLKTLGLTRPDVLRLVAWQATALAAAALLAGVPLGVVAGRAGVGLLRGRAGVAAHARRPVVTGAARGPVTLLLANVIAALPGWAAARLRPAVVLRTE